MPRITHLVLAALVVAALPACSFSEGGDFDCTDGATVTATVDGRSFRADCVETNVTASTLFVGGYDNYDSQDGTDVYSNIRLSIGGISASTFALAASGSTTLSYYAFLGDADADMISADATTGSVVITSATDSQISGTFQFSAPEEIGTDRTSTGETITGTGSFSIPR